MLLNNRCLQKNGLLLKSKLVRKSGMHFVGHFVKVPIFTNKITAIPIYSERFRLVRDDESLKTAQ